MADMTISGGGALPLTAGCSSIDGPQVAESAPPAEPARPRPARLTSDGFDQPARDYSTLRGAAPSPVQAQSNTSTKGNRLPTQAPASNAPTGGRTGWGVGAPDPTINTIVCDGKGSIATQVLPISPTADGCIRKCIEAHESSHKDDAKAATPNVCQGQPAGLTVGVFGGQPAVNATEIKAYTAQIDCLKNELPTASPVCKPIISNNLSSAEKARKSYGGP
jgi:hypothetical protein